MTANHQTILAELYEIDPSLREHEAELVPLIQKLLERDPAQKPSPAFVKKLRKELAARAEASMHGAVEHRVSYASPSGFFHRFAYALAGATAAVVIAVPVTLQWANGGVPFAPMAERTGEEMDAGTMAMNAENQANDAVTGSPAGNNPAPYAMGRTQAGGGGGDMYMGDGKMTAVSSLIAPWNPVKYRLEGDLPELPQGTVDVLERNLRTMNVPFASIQNAFRDAAIDLSSFEGTSVDHVSMTQRRQFGYTINVSLADGSVSINQAWEFWPQPANNCQTEECFRSLQPKLSDIPADAELIRIAGAFLADHDIDLEGYGDPVVDHAWRRDYDRTEDKRYAWVPDSMRVIFPLVVDGQTVTEPGGGPSGISVQVSVKHKRVSDAWGLMTYQFDREAHDAVSDRADIEKFLGMAGSQTADAPTIALRDPTLGYVRLYTYEDGKNSELFVPALIFQVTNVPADAMYYPASVAVPLAKDLLDEAQPPMPIDPMPMPRPMDGGGPAVDVPVQEPLMVDPEAR